MGFACPTGAPAKRLASRQDAALGLAPVHDADGESRKVMAAGAEQEQMIDDVDQVTEDVGPVVDEVGVPSSAFPSRVAALSL